MMDYQNKDKRLWCSYSERGKLHIERNWENQDSIGIGEVNNGCLYIAVADGVSSCKKAKEGSLAAIDTVRHLAKLISVGEISSDNFDFIRKFVVRDWKAHFSQDWDEYGTTLNFAIVHNGYLLVGQIGDGIILVSNGNENIVLTDMDEFYSAETYALSTAVRKSTFNVVGRKVCGPLVVVAMTDGIGKEIDMEHIDGFRNALVELMKKGSLAVKSEFDVWMAQLNEKNDDDKTIGVLILEE